MLSYTIVSSVISYIFLILFFSLFVNRKYSRLKTVFMCTAAILLMWGMEILKSITFSYSNSFYIAGTIFQIVVTQGTALAISDTRDSKVLFTGLCGSNYVMAGALTGSISYAFTQSMICSVVLSVAVHALVLTFMEVRVRKIYLSFYTRQNMKSWWRLCLVPVLFYCCFCFLAIFPNPLSENPSNILGTIMLLITMFVSYVVVFRYVENEMSRNKLYWDNKLFESYIYGLESQYEAVEESERNLRILRHDMRHYTEMVYKMLEQKQYEEAKEILGQVTKVIEDTKIEKYCENIKINSIVSSLMGKIRKCGITVDIDMQVPEELPVDGLELASVVANLLENAFYSVKDRPEEDRNIRLLVRFVDNWLIVEVENKCVEDLSLSPDKKLPISSKGEGHGVGLQSVAAFADKINANLGCYYENEIFTVRLAAKF